MANINAVFTETYKRFEALARTKGYASAKIYEEYINEKSKPVASKLKLCRTIFNFLTYTSQTFIDATPQMIEFLEEQITILDENQAPIKSKAIPVTDSIHEDDLIISAINYMFMKNVSVAPVFDAKGYAIGVISFKDVAAFVATGKYNKAKTVSNIVQKVRFTFCSESTPVNQVGNYKDGQEKVCLIVNTDNKVTGWVTI